MQYFNLSNVHPEGGEDELTHFEYTTHIFSWVLLKATAVTLSCALTEDMTMSMSMSPSMSMGPTMSIPFE